MALAPSQLDHGVGSRNVEVELASDIDVAAQTLVRDRPTAERNVAPRWENASSTTTRYNILPSRVRCW
jgi:hypothetical protein